MIEEITHEELLQNYKDTLDGGYKDGFTYWNMLGDERTYALKGDKDGLEWYNKYRSTMEPHELIVLIRRYFKLQNI